MQQTALEIKVGPLQSQQLRYTHSRDGDEEVPCQEALFADSGKLPGARFSTPRASHCPAISFMTA